jgi:acetoin utilization protein AcuB
VLVRDFMTADVATIDEKENLLDASLTFRRTHFRHLPVMADGKLVGILTEGDLRQFLPSMMLHGGADEYNRVLESTPISKVMTRNPLTVSSQQPVTEAAHLLFTHHIGCLPVVENGELKGVITTTDMLRLLIYLTREQQGQQ